MEKKEPKYYLICDKTVGKNDSTGDYIFKNGAWEKDTEHLIMDSLMGYDPGEDDASPYKMFNPDIMESIKEISQEEAMKLIKQD